MEPCLENSIGFWVVVSADTAACTAGKQIDPGQAGRASEIQSDER
jgi:hypothetical protein